MASTGTLASGAYTRLLSKREETVLPLLPPSAASASHDEVRFRLSFPSRSSRIENRRAAEEKEEPTHAV